VSITLYGRSSMHKSALICIFCLALIAGLAVVPLAGVKADSAPHVRLVTPDPRGGIAYRLVYYVDVHLDTYWRFKTDFEGAFLSTNKYITQHRFIRNEGHSVLTENKYSIGPDATYRWLTKILDQQHRLEFWLLNPQECGQRFHYGYIQAEPAGLSTKVTQVAYLDFFGVSFWARFPWAGGMKDFLRWTARWEQQTALSLEWEYGTNHK